MALPAIDPDLLPSLTPAAPKRNLFAAGLSSGVDELQGLLGSAAEFAGRGLGITPLEQYGARVADRNAIEAQQNGRPDLETAPWRQGGAPVLPWLAYQTAKQVPLLGAYLIGSAAVPEAVVPASLARLGAAAPELIGGGGLRAGASFAARRAALAEGTNFARMATAGELVGLPLAAGSMYQEAKQAHPEGVSGGDLAKIAGLSPFYAALDATELPFLSGLKHVEGGIAKRVAKGAIIGGAEELVQEGIQTAMEQSFRPDLTPQQRMANIVDSAVTGAAVGGVFGGVASIRHVNPHDVSTEQLGGVVDQELGVAPLGLPAPGAGSVAAPNARMDVNTAGDVTSTPRQFGVEPDLQAPIGEVRPEAGRVYAGATDPELQSRIAIAENYLTKKKPDEPLTDSEQQLANQLQLMQAEATIRGINRPGNNLATNDNVTSPTAGAVERRSDVVEGVAARNSAAPAPATFEDQRTELFKGIAPRTRKLFTDATNMDELDAKLRQELENGRSSKSILALAERRGIDLNEPAKVAAEEPGAQGQAGAATAVTKGLADVERLADGLNAQLDVEHDGSQILLNDIQRNDAPAGSGAKVLKRLITVADRTQTPIHLYAEFNTPKLVSYYEGLGFKVTGKAGPAGTPMTYEPAAPANQGGGDQTVDADFQAKWQERIKGVKDFGLKELRGVKRLIPDAPINEEQAKLAIYDALGAVDREDKKVDGYKGVEQLAQEYDLVNEDGQLTNEGVRIARMRIPLEDTVKEAVSRGYNGTEASAFDKGARGERKVTLGSIGELQAYNDGKQWALDRNSKNAPIPATASAQQTENVLEENTAQKGGEHTVTSVGVPEKQQNMQFLNQAIDQVYGSSLHAEDQARLKKAAREGATPQQLDEMAASFPEQRRYEATGHGALVYNETPPEPYKGEVVMRGAPRNQEKLRQIRGEAATAELEQKLGKGERLQKTQALIQQHSQRKDLLRQEIQGAAESGDISGRQRIELIHRLTVNDLNGVVDRLPGGKLFNEPQVRASRREFMTGVAAAAAAGLTSTKAPAALRFTAPQSIDFRDAMNSGNVNRVLDYYRTKSSDAGYRLIAAKLSRGDWGKVTLIFHPENDANLRGLTTMNDDGSTTVEIFGKDGLNEQTVLHELIHAYAQQRWASLSAYIPENKRLVGDTVDRGDKFVQNFQDVWDRIGAAIKKTNPELLDSENDKDVWASESYRNPSEMLSWVLTNPDAQAYLKSITPDGEHIAQAKPESQKSLWDRIVDFFADIFGFGGNPKVRSALDEVLSAGYSVLDAGANVKTGDFNVKLAKRIAEARASDPLVREPLRKASEMNDRARKVVGAVTDVADRIRDTDGVKGKVRKMTLGWMSVHGANEFFGKWFNRLAENGKDVVANGVRAYEEALNAKNAIFARLSLMTTDVLDRFDQLQRTNRDSAEKIVKIMRASEFGINPTRPWKEQSEELRNSKNAANLQRLTNEYHDLYRALLSRGHADVYHDLNRVNDTQMLATLAMSLHQQVDASERGTMPEFSQAPMDAYMADQTTKDFTPQQARDWWARKVDQQVKAVFRHLDELRGERDNPNTDAKTQENLKSRIDPLGKRAADITQAVKALDSAPYFHLGRYGDYIVSWRVNDEEGLAKVADALGDAGFDGVITNGTDKREVFMRVEDTASWRKLHDLVKGFSTDVVDPGSVRARKRTAEDYTAGVDLQWVNNLIAGMKEDSSFGDDEESRKQMIEALEARALDLAPEISITRVLTKRKSIPGYSADMMRSFAWRSQVGINALAGQSVAPKITQAFVDMRGALQDVESSRDAPLNQRDGMRQIIDEYSRRERERSMWPKSKVLDQLSSVATAWFLGFSASYGFVNTTQLGVTLLPELGARHGFANAFGAMAKATPVALKIMREVARHGANVSLDRAMDAVITQDALRKVVGKEMAEFLMRVVNTGNLDIGGPSRELLRAAQGRGDEHLDRVLRYASSIGYYTETASRLIAAIATRQLNPNLSIEAAADRAAYVINETMWNYSQTNQGRQFGKMGVLGQYSPLALKFMQFQAQLTEKLMREGYNAIKGETKAERDEARRYLMGHLSAMTVLAGTLGLPAATVFATVIDRLKDLWDDDDEPSNVRTAYRNWLADAFGVKAGELISHGIFRGAGFDVSQRIGEQDIVPFSRFLADRRDAKDSTKDLAFRTWGAPTSLIAGLVAGGQQIMEGNISQGLTQMLPNAFAAPVKAYTLTQDGYVDTTGKKLPIEPGAFDIMTQLLGFNPASKAEYSEARQDQAVRKGLLVKQASNLRNQILDAVAQNDNQTARELIAQAQKFDQTNPAFAVLPSLGSTARRRARASALATATQTPLGVSIKDLEGQQLSRYANY